MDEHSIKEDILRILRILSAKNNPTQREISTSLAISLGKTNYLLKELVRRGFVKMENFSSRGDKMRKVRYIITPKGIKEKIQLTRFFLERKEKEYRLLKEEWVRLNIVGKGSVNATSE